MRKRFPLVLVIGACASHQSAPLSEGNRRARRDDSLYVCMSNRAPFTHKFGKIKGDLQYFKFLLSPRHPFAFPGSRTQTAKDVDQLMTFLSRMMMDDGSTSFYVPNLGERS